MLLHVATSALANTHRLLKQRLPRLGMMWISNMNVPDLRKHRKQKRQKGWYWQFFVIIFLVSTHIHMIHMALMNIWYGKTAVFFVVRYGKINHESRSSDEGIEAPRVSSSCFRYTQIMPIPAESQADYWQPTGILDGWGNLVSCCGGWIPLAQLPFYLCDSEMMMNHRGFPTCCSSWTLWSNSLGLSNLDMHLLAAQWDEMGDHKIHLRVECQEWHVTSSPLPTWAA